MNSPAEIRLSEGSIAQGSAIALPVAEDEPPLRRDFRLALQRSFFAQKTEIDATAPLIADFGISAVDAAIGQISDNGSAGADASLDWQAKPRRGLLLDSCDPVRAQATLAIFDRVTNEMVYRAEAEATICKSSEADLEQLAERLVDDVRLGADQAP